MKVSRRTLLAGLAGTAAGGAAVASGGFAVDQFFRRRRTVPPDSKVLIKEEGDQRIVESNGLPGHSTGDFPNPHDPFAIRAQQYRFALPMKPTVADRTTPLNMWLFGVAVNGVPFDPSGPFWNGDVAGGWQFEVLAPAGAVALGIDVNRGHTQGGGMYHYHGLPTGLLWTLRHHNPNQPMLLLGYAADGFPIYGPEAPSVSEDL